MNSKYTFIYLEFIMQRMVYKPRVRLPPPVKEETVKLVGYTPEFPLVIRPPTEVVMIHPLKPPVPYKNT